MRPVSVHDNINGATHAVVERRSAGFHPSVWGDYFLRYTSESITTNETQERDIEKLMSEVKRMLTDADPLAKLNLIDKIQRLGIGYKFEKEIDDILEHIFHHNFSKHDVGANYGHDLFTAALEFRLLRQHGYRISCDLFNKFRNGEGKFRESLIEDVRGMLSLYEASHLRVHREDILDEALKFTTRHLELAVKNDDPMLMSPTLADQVKHALKRYLHKGLTRLEASHYIRVYELDDSPNKVLLKLAKLDFNRVQKLHQKELYELTRWCKNILDAEKNFPWARDRVVETYFWILGVYFEPEYSLARMIVTKIMNLLSIMDDTYDVYGTPEELQLLTDAMERWDATAMDGLPQYMKVFYKVVLDMYSEIEEWLAEQGRIYRLVYAKKAMIDQARMYNEEEKWYHRNYIPTIEEYMALALETSGYGCLALSSFIGMGDVASKDYFEWYTTDPKIVRGAKEISRYMDDIASHKFEQERGHVASAIEVYIKNHGMTEEEAEKVLLKKIEDAWKDINEECLRPTPFPMPLLTRILNFARAMDVFYNGKDLYTNPQNEMKDYVAALLVNPIPV